MSSNKRKRGEAGRQEAEFRVAIRQEGDTTVIGLSGNLRGTLSRDDRERLTSAIQPGGQLVLDFSDVRGVSGSGLRRLLLLARHVYGLGGGIVTRGVSESIRAIGEASGFRGLFARTAPIPIPASRTLMDTRTDCYPTHSHGGYLLRPGVPLPLGATPVSHGVNFAVYSRHGTACTLVLFDPGATEPLAEIPFPPEFRVGDVHTMTVFEIDPEAFDYGLCMDGPFAPEHGDRFDRTKVLLDPAARMVVGRSAWGQSDFDAPALRARLVPQDFDWEGDRPLELPLSELVIYEMHVRGFTRSPSSGVTFPGTYAGLREKIPYLKELGVNCVELLPVFEFDELEVDRTNPLTGAKLVNYWGYSTIGFFAPKAGYAASGPFGMQADEFKTLVKELHANGIEVLLDVVFNHTSEGNQNGPTLSFRGLDNRTYYMLTPDGEYYNFSGCGNTMNCNHPVVRDFIVTCLRCWVSEYHIDGFRFDLASILGRGPDGNPLANPPLLESLALDPVLGRTKLIAEAWDAGGLYQVGHFPAYGRWGEWNGKYRDCARRFLKGDMGQVVEFAQRMLGSPDLYRLRGPTASVNFITCHDGFTLADLVSYNTKHNEANGEDNRDGANDNFSWNCGVEGATTDPEILTLRQRQIKNALTMLFLSQGVPMLLMGDEVCRTQQGNNNTYCQDNELNWLDWDLPPRHAEIFRFCKLLIAFRKAHPALRHADFADLSHDGEAALRITWHGTSAFRPDWSGCSRVLAFTARLRTAAADDLIYAAFNMYWEPLRFELPDVESGLAWHQFINTGLPAPSDAYPLHQEPRLPNQQHLQLAGRSAVVLVAR